MVEWQCGHHSWQCMEEDRAVVGLVQMVLSLRRWRIHLNLLLFAKHISRASMISPFSKVCMCTSESSTITAFYNSHTVSEWFYLIATVGDDNALVVLGLTLPTNPQTVQLEVLCSETSAHASSITGVSIVNSQHPKGHITLFHSTATQVVPLGVHILTLGMSFLAKGLLVTLSIDQRLSVWQVSVPQFTSRGVERGCDLTSKLQQLWSQTHDIADASSLALYHWQ